MVRLVAKRQHYAATDTVETDLFVWVLADNYVGFVYVTIEYCVDEWFRVKVLVVRTIRPNSIFEYSGGFTQCSIRVLLLSE